MRKRGVFGIHKTNYVVKTTELGRKPRGRCGQQMESCAGGGTLSKKCAKNANWTGAAALSPRRRGYAAKIMRRKNARRKFGKQATGESHYRNPCGIIRNICRRQCGDGCSSPFFHYYNIIVTFLICRVFFDRARKPRNTGVPACQVRLFYIASAGLDKYFVRWYNICAKRTNVRFDTRGVPEPSSGITGRLF